MADQDARALLLTIQANTELLRSNLSAAERAVEQFTNETQAHLDEQDKKFEVFGKGLEALEGPLERLKSLTEGAVGALLGESLIEAGKKGLEFAGNVKFVSEQVGTSTKFLQEYRYAAGQFGVGSAEADEGLNKFSRSVGEAANGNKTLIDLFNRLGVNVRDAGGNVRSVEAVFLDTSNAIAKIDNPAQKSADSLALMGKGASGLIPLLSSGAEGFNSLAEAAGQLGIVLSPELIQHSEDVNHKLAALKQIVDAEMASTIAQNAAAIEGLASAMVKAAGAFAKFLNSQPQIALGLLGAGAGFLKGGAIGAIYGAGAGVISGEYLQQQKASDVSDLPAREAALRAAAIRLRGDQNSQNGRSASSGIFSVVNPANGQFSAADIGPAQAEFNRQRALYQQAYRNARSRREEGGEGSDEAGATNNNGDDLKNAQTRLASLEAQRAKASGAALTAINQEIVEQKRKIGFIKQGADAELASSLAGKQGAVEKRGETDAKEAARKAEALRQKNLGDDIAYAGEVRKLREEILAGMRKTATNDAASDALQKEGINADALNSVAQNRLKFDKGDFGSDPKVAQARLDTLNDLVEQNRVQKLANVDIDRQSAVVAQSLAATQQDLQNRTALLQIQDGMATTATERRKLELQLLDIQQQMVRAALQKVLDDQKASDFDKDQARKQLNALPAIETAQRAQVLSSTRGPGEQFQADLSGQSLSEQLQGVKVDAIKGIGDDLETAAAKGLKLHGVLGTILSDLLKIAIEREVELPIANQLFPTGGSTGSSGGGGIGGIFKNVLGLFGGGGSKAAAAAPGGYSSLDYFGDFGIPGFAAGDIPSNDNGLLRGPGTGKSDSILATLPNGKALRVANGEFIMNSVATAKNLAFLRAMNEGRLQGFADGGLVGARAVIPPPTPNLQQVGQARADAVASRISLEVSANDYFDAKVASISGGQITVAAPHIAAGGAQLAGANAARARRRALG